MENVLLFALQLTSTAGCDPAASLWVDPRRWPAHTEDPRIRLRRPQTARTSTDRSESNSSEDSSRPFQIPAAYLQRLVEPAVAAVGERPASVQDLCRFTARIPVSQSHREQNSALRKGASKGCIQYFRN